MSPVYYNGWLAFELGVLRRLDFNSVALPFTGEPQLAINLKQWKVRVAANDPMLWSVTKALALIENYHQKLSAEEIDNLLEDAYVPRDELNNTALLKWFNETDAWWFDALRSSADQLDSEYKRAVALTIGMMVGDYVRSFDERTRQLRRPLSLGEVFRQMASLLPAVFDNGLQSKAFNQETRTFLAERQHTGLLFLRLPPPVLQIDAAPDSLFNWREEWLRGDDGFWVELERSRAGKLGSRVQTKQQYLGFVDDLLRTASHISAWAITHTENGFISTDELVEMVSRLRRVDAVYSKDFSDLLGVRASIVTATA
jgi:hypothetical protein